MPPPSNAGQKIFVGNCGFCHGTTAQGGDTGPDLVRSPLALDDERGDKIGPVISRAAPAKACPLFICPPTRSRTSPPSCAPASRPPSIATLIRILNVVTGDREKGREYFNGAGRCHTCHSPTGDLAGIAKKYDAVALQSRFLYPRPRPGDASRSRSQVTVTLASGQSVSGTLEYLDDFDVALRDAAGDYHSFSRDAQAEG